MSDVLNSTLLPLTEPDWKEWRQLATSPKVSIYLQWCVFGLNYPLQREVNTIPSGEREIKGTTIIYAIMLMFIASKYPINVSVSSMQKLPDIKCLSDVTGAHHVSSSILQTQRASYQKTMQRFRDQGETDSHCQVYKVLHGMWLKGRPTAFTMSSETPTTLAYFSWGVS